MIKIMQIQSNPPGKDTIDRLNEEWVWLRNNGYSRRSIAGWRLQDRAGHTFVFPAVLANGLPWEIGPGESVLVHTGQGASYKAPAPNPFVHLFWGRSWWVWNNRGDTALLYDVQGILQDTHVVGSAA